MFSKQIYIPPSAQLNLKNENFLIDELDFKKRNKKHKQSFINWTEKLIK